MRTVAMGVWQGVAMDSLKSFGHPARNAYDRGQSISNGFPALMVIAVISLKGCRRSGGDGVSVSQGDDALMSLPYMYKLLSFCFIEVTSRLESKCS
jgi:hypothetical protein